MASNDITTRVFQSSRLLVNKKLTSTSNITVGKNLAVKSLTQTGNLIVNGGTSLTDTIATSLRVPKISGKPMQHRTTRNILGIESSAALRLGIKSSEKSVVINGIFFTKINTFQVHPFELDDTVEINGHDNDDFNTSFVVYGPITSNAFYIKSPNNKRVIFIGSGGGVQYVNQTAECLLRVSSDPIAAGFVTGDTIIVTEHTNSAINGIPLIIVALSSVPPSVTTRLSTDFTGGFGGTLEYCTFSHIFQDVNGLNFITDYDNLSYSLTNDTRNTMKKNASTVFLHDARQQGDLVSAQLQTKIGDKKIAISHANHGLANNTLVRLSIPPDVSVSDFQNAISLLDLAFFQNNTSYTIDTSFDGMVSFFEPTVSFTGTIHRIVPSGLDIEENGSTLFSNNLGRVYSIGHGLASGDVIRVKGIQLDLGVPSTTLPTTYTLQTLPSENFSYLTTFKVVVLSADFFYLVTNDIASKQYKLTNVRMSEGRFYNYQITIDKVNALQRDNFIIDLLPFFPAGNAQRSTTVAINYENLQGKIAMQTVSNQKIPDLTSVTINGIQTLPNVSKWTGSATSIDSNIIFDTQANITGISSNIGTLDVHNPNFKLEDSDPNHIFMSSTQRFSKPQISSNLSAADRIFDIKLDDHSREFTFYENNKNFVHALRADDETQIVASGGNVYVHDSVPIAYKNNNEITYNAVISDVNANLMATTRLVSKADVTAIAVPNSIHSKRVHKNAAVEGLMSTRLEQSNVSGVFVNEGMTYDTSSGNITLADTTTFVTTSEPGLLQISFSDKNTSECGLDSAIMHGQTAIPTSSITTQSVMTDKNTYIMSVILPLYTNISGEFAHMIQLLIGTTTTNIIRVTSTTPLEYEFVLDTPIYVKKHELFSISFAKSSSKVFAHFTSRTADTTLNVIRGLPTTYVPMASADNIYARNDQQMIPIELKIVTTSGLNTASTANIVLGSGDFFKQGAGATHRFAYSETSNRAYDSLGRSLGARASNIVGLANIDSLNGTNPVHQDITFHKKHISIAGAFISSSIVGEILTSQIVFLSENHGFFVGDVVDIFNVFISDEDGMPFDFTGSIVVGDNSVSTTVVNNDEFRINLPDGLNVNSLVLFSNPHSQLINRLEMKIDGQKVVTVLGNDFGHTDELILVPIGDDAITEFAGNVDSVTFDESSKSVIFGTDAIDAPTVNASNRLSTRDSIDVYNVYLYKLHPSGYDMPQSISYSARFFNPETNIMTFTIDDATFLNETGKIVINSDSKCQNNIASGNISGNISSWSTNNTLRLELDSAAGSGTSLTNAFPPSGYIFYKNIDKSTIESNTSNILIDGGLRITNKSGNMFGFDYRYANLEVVNNEVTDIVNSNTTFVKKYVRDDTFIVTIPAAASSNIVVRSAEVSLNGDPLKQIVASCVAPNIVSAQQFSEFSPARATLVEIDNTYQTFEMVAPLTIVQFGVRLAASSLMPRGALYLQVYIGAPNDAMFELFGNARASAGIATDGFTYFTLENNFVDTFAGQKLTIKIIDETPAPAAVYTVTNLESAVMSGAHAHILHESSIDNAFISIALVTIDYNIDRYILPNLVSVTDETKGSIIVFNDRLLPSHYFIKDDKNDTHALLGSDLAMNSSGNIIVATMPEIDSNLGAIYIMNKPSDGVELWNRTLVHNPDRFEILRDTTITVSHRQLSNLSKNDTYTFAAWNVTNPGTANVILCDCKDVHFYPVSTPNDLSANLFIETPSDGSIVDFVSNITINEAANTYLNALNLNIENSLDDYFTISNIVFNDTLFNTSSYVLDDVYAQVHTEGKEIQCFAHKEASDELIVDSFYWVQDGDELFVRGLLKGGRTSDIIVANKNQFCTTGGSFVCPEVLRDSTDLTIVNLNGEFYNNSLNWYGPGGRILQRHPSKDSWTIDLEYGHQLGAFLNSTTFSPTAPPAGMYTSPGRLKDDYFVCTGIDKESHFGKSVDIDELYTIVVGAPAYQNGSVYLFNNDVLFQTIPGPRPGFGELVKIASNGLTIVVCDDSRAYFFYRENRREFFAIKDELSINSHNIILKCDRFYINEASQVHAYELHRGRLTNKHVVELDRFIVPTANIGGSVELVINLPERDVADNILLFKSANLTSNVAQPGYELSLSNGSLIYNVSDVEYASNILIMPSEPVRVCASYQSGNVEFFVNFINVGTVSNIVANMDGGLISDEYVLGDCVLNDEYPYRHATAIAATNFGARFYVDELCRVMYCSADEHILGFRSEDGLNWKRDQACIIDELSTDFAINNKDNRLYVKTQGYGFLRFG